MEAKKKLSELRIGNYYQEYSGKIFQFELQDFCNIKNSKLDVDEYCLPIPLSEQWLLDLGWIKNEKGFWWHNWGTNGNEIIVWAEPYKKYGYQLGNGRTKILDNVHQLQNIFHALTQNELTIINKP